MTGMLNRWNHVGSPPRYGDDDESYRRAIAFLDGPGILEDWGCGCAYAKQFVRQAKYLGIDGSLGYCDFQRDLLAYRSIADYILLRHVLEHNEEWKTILRNALSSASKRLCLVIFTPFQTETHVIGWNGNGVPDIGFRKQDLLDVLGPCREETILSMTQYGQETLLYWETR